MSEQVGSARIVIEADTANFEKSLRSGVDRAGRTFANMGKAIGQTVVGGLKAASAATLAVGAAAITAGFSYNRLGQRVTAALTTILGTRDAAREMIKEVSAFARTSPFPRQAFLAATQQLLGFGLEAEKIVPTLDAIQDATAAVGGTAQDLEEVVDVFARIQGQGKITGEELNRLGIRGIDAAKIIGDSLGQTGEEIRKSITAGAIDADTAITALTEGMKEKFGGAADNLKLTFEGALDRVKGALRDVGSAIVEPFVGFEGGGAFVDVLNAIADALRRIETEVLPKLVPKLRAFGEVIGGRVSKVFENLPELIDKVTKGASSLGKAIGPLAGAFAGLGASSALSLVPGLGGVAAALGPIPGLIVGIIAVSPAARKTLGDLLKTFLDIGKDVAAVLLPALNDMFEALEPLIPVIGRLVGVLAGQLGAVITALVPSVTKFVTVLADSLEPVLAALEPVLEEVGKALAENAEVFGELLLALVPLLPVLAELITALLPLITLLVKVAAETSEVQAQGLLMLTKALVPIAAFIGNVLAPVVRFISGVFTGFGDSLDSVGERVRALLGLMRGLGGRIVEAVGNLGKTLFRAGASLMRGLLEGIRDGFRKVRDYVGDIGDTIADLKGPLDRDRKLLVPAGNAIMEGLERSIRERFSDVKRAVSEIEGLISISPNAPALVPAGAGFTGPSNVAVALTFQADVEGTATATGAALGREGRR